MDKISVKVEEYLLTASDCIKREDYISAAAIIAEFEEVKKTCLKHSNLVEAMKVKLANERKLNAMKDPEASLEAKIVAELGLIIHPTAAATTQPASTQRPTAQQPRRQQPTPSTPPVTTAAPTTPTQPAAPTPPQGPVPPTQPTPPVEPPNHFYTPTTPTTSTRSNRLLAAIKTATKNIIG